MAEDIWAAAAGGLASILGWIVLGGLGEDVWVAVSDGCVSMFSVAISGGWAFWHEGPLATTIAITAITFYRLHHNQHSNHHHVLYQRLQYPMRDPHSHIWRGVAPVNARPLELAWRGAKGRTVR